MVDAVVKASGELISSVRPGSVYQSTVPAPPLTVLFNWVRSKVAMPPCSSQRCAMAGSATGEGIRVSSTGTASERQDPLSTAAYTIVLPERKAEGLVMLPVRSGFKNHNTLSPDPRLMIFSTVVRSNSTSGSGEHNAMEAGAAGGSPGETSTIRLSSSWHPCASVIVTV